MTALDLREGDLMNTGAVARMIGKSEAWVRYLCDHGALKFIRDSSGRRLIVTESVRDLAERQRFAAGNR